MHGGVTKAGTRLYVFSNDMAPIKYYFVMQRVRNALNCEIQTWIWNLSFKALGSRVLFWFINQAGAKDLNLGFDLDSDPPMKAKMEFEPRILIQVSFLFIMALIWILHQWKIY